MFQQEATTAVIDLEDIRVRASRGNDHVAAKSLTNLPTMPRTQFYEAYVIAEK
jgi:hypothetical protein